MFLCMHVFVWPSMKILKIYNRKIKNRNVNPYTTRSPTIDIT